MCGMSRNHEPDPCKVRSVSGKPHPQLLLTIDIPFKTIQALSIQSNKVSLLVKTVPYIQVVARRGLSRVAVPEKNALSQAQRKYFARVKAVLTIFPLHQLMLADQGRAASLCDGLCGFASWFKTCLLQQLPVPEGHIPSWCLTPHLDPDMLARKLSQHAAQGYVEATRRSTCIVRDSVSGKYFGKIVDKSDQPPDHQSSSKADQPDSNGNCKLGNFKALDVVQDIMASDEVKCSQKAEKANSSGSPLTGSRRGSIKDDTPNSRVATLYDDCVDNADKQKTTVASRKQIEITNSVEDSAAFYLLSGVRSALSSQKNARSPPFSTGLRFPPPYLEKGCTCKENCHQMECPCARGGVLCQAGQTCSCQSCDNPLNVLHILNLDIHTARIDECLMQNLYSLDITELCKLLPN
ncbi:uncharacterized protein LOC122262996 isoform X2 [Penaeus japonicus]|uniref:uncharacterized protein LOC122262996 isoform X2 n=1 Tax=Penaeus japonicus TaxID=27405 RepID=UPI001C71687E|nr:uncharacterized protein LOC122262996 isoform X2 [Penaeus japonicus]